MILVLSSCSIGTLTSLPKNELIRSMELSQLSHYFFNSAENIIPGNYTPSDPVPRVDLDFDGREEAVSFVSMRRGGKNLIEMNLYKSDGEALRPCGSISNICDRVDDFHFIKFDAEKYILVLGWWLEGADCGALSICEWNGSEIDTIYSGCYNALSVADFDADGYDELIVIRTGTDEEGGKAFMVDYAGGNLSLVSRVSLSRGLKKLDLVQTAQIGFNQTAVICEGYIENEGYVSDYIICVKGELKNIFLSEFTGVSTPTLRDYPVYSCDIDGNSYVELPILREVPRVTRNIIQPYSLWFVDWMQCGDGGMTSLICTTYNDFADSWYLILPEGMSNNVTVDISVDSADCKGVLFYYWSDEGERLKPIWEVYVFRGEEAVSHMRTLGFDETAYVYPKGYALEFYNNVYGFSYTTRSLKAGFRCTAVPELQPPYDEIFSFS